MCLKFPDMGVPKVVLPPLKIRILGPKTVKIGKKLALLVIFGQIFAFLVHFDALPDQKTMGMRCLIRFLICEYQNLGFRLKNGKILPKICILVILGQILAFLIHLVLCLTKKRCERGA